MNRQRSIAVQRRLENLLGELASAVAGINDMAEYNPDSRLYLIPYEHYTPGNLIALKFLEALTGGNYNPELVNLEIELKMMCQEIRELRNMVDRLGGDWEQHRRNFPQVLPL